MLEKEVETLMKKKILIGILGFISASATLISVFLVIHFFGGNTIVFETEGDLHNVKMTIPNGWELTEDKTHISKGKCQVTGGIVPSDEIDLYLDFLGESSPITIRGRDWNKFEDENVGEVTTLRIIYTTYEDNLFTVSFTATDEADCNNYFDQIESSIRLVR